MGLSSSQARLIHLTTRMHQIEYKAQRIEAQKLQLANDSDKVYQTYLEELEASKIQYKTLQEDGSITFQDATLSKLQELGYRFQIMGLNGFMISHSDMAMYNTAIGVTADNLTGTNEDGSRDYFIAMKTGRLNYTTDNDGNAAVEQVPIPGAEDETIDIMVNATQKNKADGEFKEIYTLSQLKAMEGSGSYRLMNDFEIDLSEGNLVPDFSGTIDGNGHTITIKNGGEALFGTVNGANISNLNIINNNCVGQGILANSISGGTYSNISVSGNVTNNNQGVGGFAGTINGATVENCSSNVIVSGTRLVGGFAGEINNCKVDNCVSNGSVHGQVIEYTYTDAQGNPQTSTGCVSGGFSGTITSSTIKNSVTNSSVTITDGTDGHVSNASSIDSGGFAGGVGASTIKNCASNGDINCTGISNVPDYKNNGQSNNEYAKTVGSFIGAINSDTTVNITGCNTTSNIDAGIVAIGGFIGYVNPNINGQTNLNIDSCNSNVALKTQAQHFNDVEEDDPARQNYNASANIIFSTGVDDGDQNTGDPTINITNFYTNNSTDHDTWGKWGDNSTPTTTATPNQNTIYAAGAHTSTTQRLEGAEAEAAGKLFDEIASGNYFFEEDAEDFYLADHKDDPVWLTNMINEGFLYLYKVDNKSGESYQVSVSTDTGLKEVQDEINLKKAEAKYEADMRRIDMKDRKYDSDLAALEAERNATKEEMETLKTVAKDNVDRTFKLFS